MKKISIPSALAKLTAVYRSLMIIGERHQLIGQYKKAKEKYIIDRQALIADLELQWNKAAEDWTDANVADFETVKKQLYETHVAELAALLDDQGIDVPDAKK